MDNTTLLIIPDHSGARSRWRLVRSRTLVLRERLFLTALYKARNMTLGADCILPNGGRTLTMQPVWTIRRSASASRRTAPARHGLDGEQLPKFFDRHACAAQLTVNVAVTMLPKAVDERLQLRCRERLPAGHDERAPHTLLHRAGQVGRTRRPAG